MVEELQGKKDEAKPFDVWEWLKSWVNAYEKQVGDGKAQKFYDWVQDQPTTNG